MCACHCAFSLYCYKTCVQCLVHTIVHGGIPTVCTCSAVEQVHSVLSVLTLTSVAGMNEVVEEEGDFLQAIDRFTEAITLDHSNHTLFSNRSAAYARVGKFSEALKDAQRCHELKRDWPKVQWVFIADVGMVHYVHVSSLPTSVYSCSVWIEMLTLFDIMLMLCSAYTYIDMRYVSASCAGPHLCVVYCDHTHGAVYVITHVRQYSTEAVFSVSYSPTIGWVWLYRGWSAMKMPWWPLQRDWPLTPSQRLF